MSEPSFDRLLRVQDLDLQIDRLQHRRRDLDARTRRDEIRTALDVARADAAEITGRRDELTAAQRRLQDEVSMLDEKRVGHRDKLYGGTIGNPRELQDLQAEVETLTRRIDGLEDQELELMEGLESVEAELGRCAVEEADLAGSLDATEAELIAEEAEIDAEITTVERERDELIDSVAPELAAEYRQIRAGRGGIAVARLAGQRCGACHLDLAKMAVAAIKKEPDRIHHCEECGSIILP